VGEIPTLKHGVVAQLVEQWTENPCVAGSIPADTTVTQESHSGRLRQPSKLER
jgi:hypothetical protein